MSEQQTYRDRGAPAAAVPLIDLDLVLPPDEVPARPPAGRALKAAVLAIVTLFGLGASAAPRADISRVLTVGSTPAAAYVLTTDAVFVSEVPDGSAGDSVLRKLALDGGAVQWSTALPETAREILVQADARALLVVMANRSTTAVDADSGRVLWRSSGIVTDLTADAALIARYSPDRRTALLRLVSSRTGTAVWERPVPVNATWRVLTRSPSDPHPHRLVVISENGAATTLRFDTGAALAGTDLDVRLREWEGNYREDYRDDFSELSSVGDALYVVARRHGTVTLTAYDGDTLTVRWRAAGVPPGRVDACGSVLCVADLSVFGSDPSIVTANREIVAIDPATGARRWISRDWRYVSALSADRLVASADVGNAQQAPWRLLDAATGRVVGDLGVGNPLAARAGGPQRFVHLDTARPQRVWVSTVDLRTGRSSVVGSIDRVTTSCDPVGAHITCAVIGGPLTVWRLPR